MPRIRCFLIEPTGRVEQRLRRYSRHDRACPLPYGYHNASIRIEDAPARLSERGHIENGIEGWPHDDPRWPTQCACGYEFQPEDEWQLFCDRLYRCEDTGEEYTIADAPAGAMFRETWATWAHSQDDGPPLAVKTPAGAWNIDSCSTGCSQPQAPNHHCWTRTGTPPDVTASPSIKIGDPERYHGWLRSGYLEDA